MNLHVDGDMPEHLLPELMRHLENCPACSEEYRQLQRLHHEIKSVFEQEPSHPDFDLLVKRVEEEMTHQRWRQIRKGCGLWLILMGALLLRIVHWWYTGTIWFEGSWVTPQPEKSTPNER